jgi:hypothetical protein
MKVPRFRIAWVMVFVALAALNFTVVRAALDGIISELLAVGAMPMATVLAIGLLIGYRRPGSRPFLLGFESFGALALAFYIALASCFDDEAVNPYLGLLLDPIAKAIGTRPVVWIPIACSVGVVMLGLPQLAFALTGGFLSRKYRITIDRRPAQLSADR